MNNTFILIGIICLPLISAAQEAIQPHKVHLGAFVAPTMSWMKPTTDKSDDNVFDVQGNGSRIGFTYGLLADFYFTDNYAIASGVQVNMTGGSILAERSGGTTTEPSSVNGADFTYHLSFVEVPLNIKMRTDPVGGFYIFGQAGITAGINIVRKATYDVSYISNDGLSSKASGENEKLKGTLATPPMMLQMNIGAGIEYPLTDKLSAYAALFFNNGFVPDATNPAKYKMPYDGSFRDGNTRLNNFALRFGIYF